MSILITMSSLAIIHIIMDVTADVYGPLCIPWAKFPTRCQYITLASIH